MQFLHSSKSNHFLIYCVIFEFDTKEADVFSFSYSPALVLYVTTLKQFANIIEVRFSC